MTQDNYGKVKRQQKRSVRESEIVPSDRADLVDSANSLVSTLMIKKIAPLLHSSMPSVEELDLTSQESDAYNAALNFLEKEFYRGAMRPEKLSRRTEDETTTEYHDLATEE